MSDDRERACNQIMHLDVSRIEVIPEVPEVAGSYGGPAVKLLGKLTGARQ